VCKVWNVVASLCHVTVLFHQCSLDPFILAFFSIKKYSCVREGFFSSGSQL